MDRIICRPDIVLVVALVLVVAVVLVVDACVVVVVVENSRGPGVARAKSVVGQFVVVVVTFATAADHAVKSPRKRSVTG